MYLIKKEGNSMKFINQYQQELNALLSAIDSESFDSFAQLILECRENKGRIFVAGNGGSASTVNHFTCDFSKNAASQLDKKFTVISLCSLTEAITAYGNDDGYEKCFVHQIRNFYPDDNDLIILVSASGNSPNIIEVSKFCNDAKTKIVSISGFCGGKVKDLSDINFHISSNSYEQIEDVQSIILHMVTCYFKMREE